MAIAPSPPSFANQAPNIVVAALADHMATQARALDAQIIVGLPTLGLAFASLVAERLGQSRYVPLGYSRKFWYDDALSEPITSITSPETGKQLRLDPNLLPRRGACNPCRHALTAKMELRNLSMCRFDLCLCEADGK
jgi:adenine/guanine phosphoribosyltransferase-like PRPP-binding protein